MSMWGQGLACRTPRGFGVVVRQAHIDGDQRQRQGGVAAIELSLTLMILLMLIFAVVSYGALFWVKQSMNTVAADTARHVLLQSYIAPASSTTMAADAQAYACHAAQQLPVLRVFSDLQGQVGCDGFARATLATASACTVVPSTALQCLSVTLNLKARNWPLVNTLSQFASALSTEAQAWIPDQLSTTATVLVAQIPTHS